MEAGKRRWLLLIWPCKQHKDVKKQTVEENNQLNETSVRFRSWEVNVKFYKDCFGRMVGTEVTCLRLRDGDKILLICGDITIRCLFP